MGHDVLRRAEPNGAEPTRCERRRTGPTKSALNLSWDEPKPKTTHIYLRTASAYNDAEIQPIGISRYNILRRYTRRPHSFLPPHVPFPPDAPYPRPPEHIHDLVSDDQIFSIPRNRISYSCKSHQGWKLDEPMSSKQMVHVEVCWLPGFAARPIVATDAVWPS